MDKDGKQILNSYLLKQLRRQHGLSQEALADACERKSLRVSIATIKRAETAKAVTYRTLRNLAEFYAVPANDLIMEGAGGNILAREQDRFCLLVVIKTPDLLQRQYIQANIERYQPLFKEYHGNNLVAAFNRFTTSNQANDGKPSHTLYSLNQLYSELKQQSSILSPFFFMVTLAPVVCQNGQYQLESNQLAMLLQPLQLIPQNQFVLCDAMRALYEHKFHFSELDLPDMGRWWCLEGWVGYSTQRSPLCGRERELEQVMTQIRKSRQSMVSSSVWIQGDSGLGKTHLLDELSRRTAAQSWRVYRTDIEQAEMYWLDEIFTCEADVIVIDNLHLAVQSEIAQLRQWQQSTDQLLTIIVTAEPPRSEMFIEAFSPDLQLDLLPLSYEACREIAQAYPQHSSQHQELLITRSGGNPLYLMLLLNHNDSGGTLPHSLRLVLQDHIDNLGRIEQAALRLLAVSGQPCSLENLQALLGSLPDLPLLYQLQVLVVVGVDQVVIAHEMIREVVLQSLPDELVSAIHLQLGQYFEKINVISDLQQSEWLYQQFLAAGNPFKATFHLCHKANLMLNNGDYTGAENSLEQAKALLVEAKQQVADKTDYTLTQCVDLELDLMFYLANVYKIRYGWYSPSLAMHYNKIIEKCDLTNSNHRKVNGLFGLWTIALTQLDITKAKFFAEKALEVSESLDDDTGRMLALTALGNTCFWAGEPTQTYSYTQRALDCYSDELLESDLMLAGQDPRMLAWCFLLLSASQLEKPDTDVILEQMMAVSREVGHPFSLAIALQAGAWYHWQARNPAQSLYYANELADISQVHGFPFYTGVAALFSGWAEYQLSPSAAHIDTVANGYQRWLSSAGFKLTHSLYAVLLAQVLVADGQYELARKLVEDAIREALESGAECYLPDLYSAMAQLEDALAGNSQYWYEKALTHRACSPQQEALIRTMQRIRQSPAPINSR
ncbi:AAA family ATPase [Photobacterium nomapromontoriensis]|uniref:AAA family ATPase n=1 Tax=Photobacterium nomapromontoriensis TaxID=2910237 RepID=UPI003D10B770